MNGIAIAGVSETAPAMNNAHADLVQEVWDADMDNALGVHRFRASTISRINKKLDSEVEIAL